MQESHTRQMDNESGKKRTTEVDRWTTSQEKQKCRLGTASDKITGGGGGGGGNLQLVCGRPTVALSSASVPQTLKRV